MKSSAQPVTVVKQLFPWSYLLACVSSVLHDDGQPLTQETLITRYPAETRRGLEFEGALELSAFFRLLKRLGYLVSHLDLCATPFAERSGAARSAFAQQPAVGCVMLTRSRGKGDTETFHSVRLVSAAAGRPFSVMDPAVGVITKWTDDDVASRVTFLYFIARHRPTEGVDLGAIHPTPTRALYLQEKKRRLAALLEGVDGQPAEPDPFTLEIEALPAEYQLRAVLIVEDLSHQVDGQLADQRHPVIRETFEKFVADGQDANTARESIALLHGQALLAARREGGPLTYDRYEQWLKAATDGGWREIETREAAAWQHFRATHPDGRPKLGVPALRVTSRKSATFPTVEDFIAHVARTPELLKRYAGLAEHESKTGKFEEIARDNYAFMPELNGLACFRREDPHGGDVVEVRAWDNFEVVDVRVQILDAHGRLLEEGSAEDSEHGWYYDLRGAVAGGQALTVVASASNNPGNTSVAELVVPAGAVLRFGPPPQSVEPMSERPSIPVAELQPYAEFFRAAPFAEADALVEYLTRRAACRFWSEETRGAAPAAQHWAFDNMHDSYADAVRQTSAYEALSAAQRDHLETTLLQRDWRTHPRIDTEPLPKILQRLVKPKK